MECIIRKGAVKELARLCEGFSSILYVADKNTYEASGLSIDGIFVFDTPESTPLVPNEESIAALEARVTDDTDLIVGIGSGVINDLCKYVSFQHKLPYYIVATAPSMDGYASVGAAMIINNMKITYTAHAPEAIIADVDILKNAPGKMIQAGYGDIIGKYSALNDWELANLVIGESIDYGICAEVREAMDKVIALKDKLLDNDDDSIQALTDALIMVGIAMKKVGNSRPASGSEHHLSHFFEITGLIDNTPYFDHGIDVAYSTVVTAKLRDIIADGYIKPSFDRSFWESRVNEIYKKAAPGIIELQDKVKFHELTVETAPEKINEILRRHPGADEILSLIEPVGYDMKEFVSLYGEDKIRDAVYYAKDLKDRYTVLWLLEEKKGV
ncbi:MAG: sn-glycerol-1-phosphate dehydrogenase [Clostridia bacterium]|nr:sn-glycerol-1-phosphate dehydrogenase [Clostridia bacterium]